MIYRRKSEEGRAGREVVVERGDGGDVEAGGSFDGLGGVRRAVGERVVMAERRRADWIELRRRRRGVEGWGWRRIKRWTERRKGRRRRRRKGESQGMLRESREGVVVVERRRRRVKMRMLEG